MCPWKNLRIELGYSDSQNIGASVEAGVFNGPRPHLQPHESIAARQKKVFSAAVLGKFSDGSQLI